MKKYLSFFRLRFAMGLQYRTAALAGIATQFFWGFMEIMVMQAFYRADSAAFPMSFEGTASYIWLQQAFLALFMAWMMEDEIFDGIINGNVAYELCRPINIYHMWFARSVANRLSKAVLRCVPILIVAGFLPEPYGMTIPKSFGHFLLFLLTMVLGLLVTVAACMVVYVLTFFTISPTGLRMIFVSGTEFLSGGVIPLPFFPDSVRRIIELLPFASMQNVPLLIYSDSMTVAEMEQAVFLQVFWLAVLILFGRWLCSRAEKRITLQGG